MRSDWHRYNLKRRVASLPPLSSEVFNEKVLTAQATTNAAAAKASFQKTCTACQKTYFSENAYENHIGSQKHKLKAAAMQRVLKDETSSVNASMISSAFSLGVPVAENNSETEADSDLRKVVDSIKKTSLVEKDAASRRHSHSTTSETTGDSDTPMENIPLSRCLFCNYDSPTVPLSVLHMSKFHGLFIPEQKYLADMEGLLQYLQAKIHENNECLYCHKLKGTTSGVQTHMRDKGHCMIAFETEEEMIEIGQFYDFRSTYSDDEEDEWEDEDSDDTATGGGARVREPGEDDSWETDSSASSLDSDDISAVPIDDHSHQYSKLANHRHHSRSDPRPHKNADGFHSHAHSHNRAAFHDGYELHLPSGRTAGHRSLRRYFRQNLHNYPTPEERQQRLLLEQEKATDEDGDEDMADVDSSITNAQSRRRRNNGPRDSNGALITRSNAGMLGATDAQRQSVQKAEKRDKKKEQRARNKYQAKVEKQNNSQKHFRDPLLQ